MVPPERVYSTNTGIVRLAPNGTNLGLFKISFSTDSETDLKVSHICPIRGQVDIPAVTPDEWGVRCGQN